MTKLIKPIALALIVATGGTGCYGRGGALRSDSDRVAAAGDGVAQAVAGRVEDHGAGAGAAGVDSNQSGELLGHSLPIRDRGVLDLDDDMQIVFSKPVTSLIWIFNDSS